MGIEHWIFRERSSFQEVAIARVPLAGRGLFLDSVVELLECDELVYHESVALPPLLFHPRPRRVLIQGGGDGLVLREILRDPRVEEVVLVEIDGLVIDACKAHLAELHRGSFDDPRVRLLVQDVFPYLETTEDRFDVTIVDLLDGYDSYSVDLYRKVLPLTRRVLGPDAVVGAFGDLAQPGCPARIVRRELERQFGAVATHRASIDSFSSEYAFFLASSSESLNFRRTPTELIGERAAQLQGDVQTFVPEHLPVVFEQPPVIEALLREAPEPGDVAKGRSFTWLSPERDDQGRGRL